MQKFKSLDDAIALAEFAHRNQTDKAGLAYIKHPMRVLENVQAMGGLPYVQIGAVLHDVTEDTAFTHEMLAGLGFAEPALEIVKLLDRGYSSNMFDRINYGRDLGSGLVNKKKWYVALGPDARDEFYYAEIRKNPGARMVKQADINDNLLPWRQSYLSDETQARLQEKYAKAKELLGI